MDSIVIKRGVKAGNPPIEIQDQILDYSQWYTVPYSGNYYVQCVWGGGGGGNAYTRRVYAGGGGGGSGYINGERIELLGGQLVYAYIGSGGQYGSGGTTSFGTYLSATGGSVGGRAYQNSAGLGGSGANNGSSGVTNNTSRYAYGGYGGWLYNDNINDITPQGQQRLYYGDGGNGGSGNSGSGLSGSNGCIIIKFLG